MMMADDGKSRWRSSRQSGESGHGSTCLIGQLIKLSVAALLLMVGQWLFTPSFEIAWPVLLAIAVALAGRPAAGVLRRRDSKNTGEQR